MDNFEFIKKISNGISGEFYIYNNKINNKVYINIFIRMY